ncbi:LPD38 domain-containing protein [Aeromonas tecta]|uniref:LPD38 domain-containing protein n=1 Tax=Aeromonas tecta TaxID=324617 RepID=UPI0006811CBF|nr:LPD38 domain-containing protein [Aeromonas tecta]
MDKNASTLPMAQQSDTRMDEFWNSLDAGLAAPAPTPRNLDVGLSDVARAVGAGGLELVGGIGELARQAGNYGRQNGGKDQGDYLDNARANLAKKLAPALDVVAGAGGLAQSGADSLKEGMSVDAREAMTRSLVSESPSGSITLGDGAGDIDVWAMKMAQGVGSLLPTLASGGITGLAAKATIGRMVTASMIKRGAAQEVAEAVAAKTVSRLATGAATTTGVTGSVGAAGVNARDSVLGMSFDELRNSTTFRDTFLRIDADQQTAHLSDSEKLQLAREETANVASQATMGDAKTWGAAAVGTLMGDTMLFKMLAGKGAGGGVLKGMGKGAAGEGISEALEEGTQQYSVNEALNEVAGANIDPMKGVVSSAIEGGLIGMGVGGATGGVGGLRGERGEVEIEEHQAQDAEPTAQDSVPDEQVEPQVTPEPEVPTATDQSPLGPSASQYDELRDVPAYLRQDDTADRFKGLAQDSEVQRALAGEFGSSVQELVSAQIQGGNKGKSLYERVQTGELGEDPFAGGKSALQVAMEGHRPALPLKDVIFAGDANAKPKGKEVAAPGDHDDHQAGPGPQFRGSERTRWQSGQEGDLLPADRGQMQNADSLPGATIEGEGREIGTELPHRDVIYGGDQRQPDAAPMRGSTSVDPTIGPLKSLRVTRKGKPFASEKEAQLASRKGLETPVQLNGGGFGVAEISEVERAKAGQSNNRQPQQLTPAVDTGYRDAIPSSEQPEVTYDQPARIPASSSEGQGDQPGAGNQAATDAKPATAGLASRAGARDRGELAPPVPTSTGQQQDDKTLTTPAPAGVVVSEPVAQVEAARAEVNTEPTQAQKEAGNYKKGHLKLHGFDIALENPKGSTRSGTAPDGKAWQSTMAHDYGYIKRTEGADGDHVDVFIGDQPESEQVYVVDQVDPQTGKFDEHKVMLGFADEAAARAGYLANYEPGWKGLGTIKAMPVKAFKRWLKEGDTTQSISRAKRAAQESITDFGEKIGGARKDVWASYRDSIQGDTVDEIKELPLSKAWPTPDYQKLLDSGIQPWFVAYARAARDSIPAKPQTGWKQQRWAEAVKTMRDTALGLLEGDSSSEQLRQQIAKSGLHLAEDISNRAALYEAVGHQRSLADLKLRGGEYSLYNGVKYDPPKQMWTLERGTKSSALGNWPRIIATGDTKQETIAAFKDRYEELTAEASKPKAVTFDIYSRDDGKGWFVGKKLGRNYLDLTPAFKNVKEARTYRAEHQDELIAKLEQHKAIPRERRDLNQPRVGEDMRAGQDVTPEQFASTFGFRGVEFGNWVEQGRRQRDLNDAFDALMDMAAILGIPPKAISLNGELGLAFGARGSGGVSPAAAHYEPGKMVINLTKMNGAGSLGHEWWHALDNYFSRLRGKPGDNMTTALDVSLAAQGSNFAHRGEVRKEMVEAFGEVMRAIKQTSLKARSQKLDSRRSKAYWATDVELSARAFESYLIAKLQDQSASNDYLANIVSEAQWEAEAALGLEMDDSYPYATAGEVPAIRAGFDQLFDTLESKQEGDRTVLFSKQAMAQGDKPAKHLTRKEAELVTKMWFKQYRGASGINVQIHATQAELEQALGLDAKDGLIRRAAFDDDAGTLHVAADTIANPKRMREILRHEVLAHYGLAIVLGDGEYTKLMSRLIQSQKDPSMKVVWDWVNTHYADEDVGTQAEEVVAHLAEMEQGAWGRGWDRVVAWVTRALRAVGFLPDGITAAETRSLIEGLGKKLQRTSLDDGGSGGKKFSQEEKPGQDIFKPNPAEAEEYRRQLAKAMVSPRSGEIPIDLGRTPMVLQAMGAPDLAIRISRDIVRKAVNGVKHDVSMGTIEALPGLLSDPLAIFDSKTHPGDAIVVLLDAKDGTGRPVIAALQLKVQAGKFLEINRIASIHGRPEEQLQGWVEGGLAKYIKKNHRSSLRTGLQLPLGSSIDGSNASIFSEGDAVNLAKWEGDRDDGSLPPDGLKFSQTNAATDEALQKLNLGPKPDIIDKTKTNLNKLRQVDRGVVSSWIDRVIKKANTEVLDALAPIKYAEEAAGITEAADSGYVGARMATGAASTMQATMLYGLPEWKDGVIQRKAGTGEKDALLGIFSDLGKDLHNWLGWMAGHRAEILMGQGRENLLSEQDITALKGLGNGKEAKFMEAKERWNKLNTATLDLAQEAGLFTAEARAEFESEWYIPFFRESDDGDVVAPFKPKGIANQNAGIKKLKGGEANTNDLLENIFTSTSKLIDASMKNMAAQKTVWNLADTGIIEVVAKPNMMDWRALKNGKDLITVKLEGEDYMIRVEDPDLYRAMTFFDRKPFGAMVNVAAKAKRLLTAGVTASPEFMLRNFLRDSLSSWAISKDGFKPVIGSIKGVKKTLAMEGSTIDVMFSGASFLGGYVNGNDPTAMADTVRKSLRRKGMTPEQIAKYEKSIIRNAAHAKGVVADVWEKYSRFGEAFENGNREAVYDAAIKSGKSHAQAAFESKDLMDFSMLGAARAIQGAAMVLPFFNARLQGLGKLTRELRDNPREIVKRAGMITAMSLGLLATNWDDERYEELPDWDKDANWHFFVGGQHWRIPKPFEIGVMFGTIPERMVRALGDKDTGAQFGKAVARAIGDTFALNPTPQIVKPMVEGAFNYDSFRGGPIDSPQDLAVRAEARYNEQTSLLMRELGELSGLSPKQLEHLVIGYTGTMGSYVMAAADGLIRNARPGESASWRADEIPLVKAVYRGTGPAKSTQHMEEFYRMLSEVNQLKRTVDQYRSEGLTDKASELLEEQGGILKSRRNLSRTQQQIRVVRNRIELIQRDKTMGAEEKRQRIDELMARRNDLVYQAVNTNQRNWE